MRINRLLGVAITWCCAALAAGEEGSLSSGWVEEFSDQAAFQKNWSAYGFLADGRDDKHPHGRPVSGKEVRPEWWKIVDGALPGRNFLEEFHPAGITWKIAGNARAGGISLQAFPRGHGEHHGRRT